VAQALNVLEHRLHVPQVVDEVRQDDDVVRFARFELVDIAFDEAERWVPCAGALDVLVRKIDANAQ
jgi:hypothetical protein